MYGHDKIILQFLLNVSKLLYDSQFKLCTYYM